MPAIALVVSLIVLSQSALLVRMANDASALDIGLWRMVIAVPILLLLAAGQGRLNELRRIRSGQLLALALCGLCLFLHWWTWFLAVQTTALANAMVLFAMSPLFTAIGAWLFFQEPFEQRHGFALACCFFGVCLLFRDSLNLEPARLRGDLLGFLASLLFSLYVLLGKGIRRGLGNVAFTVVTYTSCGLLFLVALLFSGRLHANFGAPTWGALIALAIGPTLLGHALFTYCLQFFNVNLMNILILTEPVLGSLVAYWVLGEAFSAGVVAGFLVICVGICGLFVPVLVRGRRPS